MLAPALTAHADMRRHHIAVSVSGPLTTEDHADALKAVCMPLPRTYGLIVNLSGVTVITEAGLKGLRQLAQVVRSAGHSVAFVCSELIMRAELILADLDTLAPVLEDDQHAFAIVGYAA
jgi:anti-anti-sigma regulatory factor